MSHDTSWDVESERDEHESAECWELRREFLLRWRDRFPRERLICLARVFTNIEFMGCRYPQPVMQEIAALSQEVAKSYRSNKQNKLQRTFVSASDAAEDRAKGVKRKGGVVSEGPPKKINFVAQGHSVEDQTEDPIIIADDSPKNSPKAVILLDSDDEKDGKIHQKIQIEKKSFDYMEQMNTLQCLDMRSFRDKMFFTNFGKLVMLVRPWLSPFTNIVASCSTCGLTQNGLYENGCFTFRINGQVVASATGATKAEARSIVETMAWNRLRSECIMVIVKELFIAQDDARITSDDVSGNGRPQALDIGLGTPLESNVASKMMKMMGWSGGGLGAKEEGISEPIRPHLQQIHRAGLGSGGDNSIHQLRRSAGDLMRKFRADDTLDIDLVFSNDFSKEERAELHMVAKKCGLISKSYGSDNERFLVVRKRIDPFTLAKAVIHKGGFTPKYQVYIPHGLGN